MTRERNNDTLKQSEGFQLTLNKVKDLYINI